MIEVHELTKTYGSHTAVDRLSFTAPPGKVTGFLGPNGAGKTTTFRCLLGLARPSAGTALIGGRAYRDLAAPRRTVGAVLESTGFHPSRTGRDHLRVLARAAGLAAASSAFRRASSAARWAAELSLLEPTFMGVASGGRRGEPAAMSVPCAPAAPKQRASRTSRKQSRAPA